MKLSLVAAFLLSSPFLLTGVVGQSCFIASSVPGSGNSDELIITLRPTPAETIAALGLTMQSPLAIVNALQGATNVAQSIINTGLRIALGPFGPVPSCEILWISNQLVCKNFPVKIIKPLCATFSAISNVTNPITFPIPANPLVPLTCEDDTDHPWGVKLVGAPEAWAQGINGTGVVVANIDTGVLSTHIELAGKMRPTYNWYDPATGSPTPNDGNGHGTHTMGSMIGATVGVAPGAQFIACKGCASDSCDNVALLKCMQWMACPDGKAANCTTIPDIINCSWGSQETGTEDSSWANALRVFQKMGIFTFFSAGNSGPSCGSMCVPADQNWTDLGFFSVAASACNDAIASFSSAGPSKSVVNYPGGLGISFASPGVNVKSAWNTTDSTYNTISGTSMASPMSAGVAALVLQKYQGITYSQLAARIMTNPGATYRNPGLGSAQSLLLNCGGDTSSADGYPNNRFGYGRVDATSALL